MDYSFEEALMRRKIAVCKECGGNMVSAGVGTYKCEKCGIEELDDFGIVRKFLNENGPQPAHVIAEKTGVDREFINSFVHSGRLQVANTAKKDFG